LTDHPTLESAPRFDVAAARDLAREHFGVDGDATPLTSERDQNFLISGTARDAIVLKIANARDTRPLLEAQQAAMSHLAPRTWVPRVVHAVDGATLVEVASAEGRRHLAWAIGRIDGVPLATLRRRSPALLEDLGRAAGQLSAALADFDHPAVHRDFYWDLAGGRALVERQRALVTDPLVGAAIDRLMIGFEKHTTPVLAALRRSAAHNDLNDGNVLVSVPTPNGDSRVVGIVDFGDMVHTFAVAELAVACAYAMLDTDHPLTTTSLVVRGYHAACPLDETELSALFGLVALRLCMSACIAADQQRQNPDNAYLGVSQSAIADTLPVLAAVPYRFAEAVFRDACGLEPIASSGRVRTWLADEAPPFAPVLGVDLRTEPCIVLDLGVASTLMSDDPTRTTEPELTERVFAAMSDAGVAVSVGRYDEPRLLYQSEGFATGSRITDERRTLHIGLDLFAVPGTPVYAPLDGVVHAFADNDLPLDYGPVIVLRHETDDGTTFFTVYGHLSRESLASVHVGQRIAAGGKLATLGNASVNGGWTPHLHLQIVTDLLDLGTDFPGVGRVSARAVWRSLSPDPNLLVGIPAERFPPDTPGMHETKVRRRERLGGNLSVAYRRPVKIVRGWGQYLFDAGGRRYIDAYNNVPHVGHCHPRVVDAAARQMRLVNTNTRYLNDLLAEYADRLTETLPPSLEVCYFLNSASEANELALRLARTHTGQRDMIVLDAAYHGNTTSLVDLSPYKHAGPGGEGAPDWVHVAPIADDYRGAYKRSDPEAGPKFASHVGEIVARLLATRRDLAGFIAETCPSVGGQIVFPTGYLADVYRYVRAAGGICIADEVQTGLGRMGTHFWAFEAQDVVPDIVVAGKPLGNGHPIAAVVTTRAIADSFDNGMEFFSTFGGNTVSCAVGLAVLDVLRDEGLQANALRVGERMLDGLRPLASRHEIIGDVRGTGLFLGVELVRDRETLEPAGEEASWVVNRMRELGVLAGTDGPYHNVVKIRPPMPIGASDADLVVEAFTDAVARF
jgi:4-aminobutyrate aminotransferase-like enzyme/Ser/Thr protein kinase RdoA (MazF antagonist)